jgi:hypothetical protein
MDESARKESELLDLLSAVWDDRLDAVSRARLEELLSRDDFAAIELLTSYARLHLDLEWLVSSKAAQERAMRSLKHAVLASERKRRRRRWKLAGLAGVAASILVTIVSIWFFTRPVVHQLVRAPQPVGEVVRLENADWASGTGLQTGDALLEGQTVDIERGFAQLSMGFGADVLLEGPCRARIASSNRVALERGKLAVRAAKWAVGFKVETDDLLATDLGTWFNVQSGGGGPAEIHVLEGLVLAKPNNVNISGDDTRRVKADEAVHVARDGTFQAIAFRRDVAAEKKLTQFQPLRPIQIRNTGIGLREGDKDPHWMVTTGDDQAGPYPQSAVVGVPHGSYGINEPDRSQWISVDRGTTKGVPPRSRYTFETTFDLTGFDLSSVWVSGLVLADDGVDEVWLNGKQLNISPWKDWGYGVVYATFHPIEIRGGFVPGVNRLAFVVKNETFIYRSKRGFDLPETPNPMALRAEWQAFGRPTSGSN